MNKKLLAALGVVALLVVAMGARMFMTGGSRTVDPSQGPEVALPAVAEGQYVLIKLENPGNVKKKIKTLAGTMPMMLKSERFVKQLDGTSPEDVLFASRILDEAADIFDVAKQAALLVAPSGGGSIALSLLVDDEAFAKLIAGERGSYAVSKWETPLAGSGEAWKIAPEGGNEGLFVLRPEKKQALVMISDKEAGIEKMLEASKKSSARISIRRYNEGPDYIQARVDVPVQGEAGPKPATFELAWVEDARSMHVQVHNEVFSVMTGKEVPKSGLEGKGMPLVGSGELAFVAGIDVPFACFVAFPMEEDPVAAMLEKHGRQIPPQQREDIATLLRGSRISTVGLWDPKTKQPGSIYFVLESKEKEVVDRLTGMANLFMRPTTLAGWDTAMAGEAPMVGPVVLARKGNYLIVGSGAIEEYAKKPSVPKELKDFAAPHDLVNVAVASGLLNAGGTLRDAMHQQFRKEGIPPEVADMLRFTDIDALQFRLMTPEKGNLGIYWEKD